MAWARTSTARSRRWKATTAPMCGSMPPPARTRTCWPIWSGGCSKTARTVLSSTAWRMPKCPLPIWRPIRWPTWRSSIPIAIQPFHCRKTSSRAARIRPGSTCPIRWCSNRCRNASPHSRTGTGLQSRPSCRVPMPKSPRSTSRTTCRPKSARAATHSISKSRKRSRAPKQSSRAGIGWAARNARCCSKRRPICSRNIPTNSSACASARRARR